MILYDIACGSYAQILLNETSALKKPIDKITEDTAYFIFREGLYLKHGYGPKFLGPGVRYENKRCKFVGYFMARNEESLNKYVPVKESHFCLFLDIARSLEKLHSDGHVHCDIKPSNILVNSDCVACLTDFGLSSYSSTSGPSPCKAQGPLYTPVFRAPEHLRGSETVTAASDIWAFGMTMFTAVLMPRYPGLETSNPQRLIDFLHLYIDEDDSKRLDHIKELCAVRKIPEDFASIVSKCLNWIPTSRPSAKDLVNDFQKYDLKRSSVLKLKLTRPVEIDVELMKVENLASIPMSQFQKERLYLNFKNFCTLLNIEGPNEILSLSSEYCSLLDTYRPNIHNPALACILALYTIRESSSLQFSNCAKMMSCNMTHFAHLLEESMCYILQVQKSV